MIKRLFSGSNDPSVSGSSSLTGLASSATILSGMATQSFPRLSAREHPLLHGNASSLLSSEEYYRNLLVPFASLLGCSSESMKELEFLCDEAHTGYVASASLLESTLRQYGEYYNLTEEEGLARALEKMSLGNHTDSLFSSTAVTATSYDETSLPSEAALTATSLSMRLLRRALLSSAGILARDACPCYFLSAGEGTKRRRARPAPLLLGAVTHLDARNAATRPSLNTPTGVCVSPDGDRVYICDRDNRKLRSFTHSSGAWAIVAERNSGTSVPGMPSSWSPCDACITEDGATLYVADWNGHSISSIDLSASTFTFTTLAGGVMGGNEDGVGPLCRLNQPYTICCTPSGEDVYITELGNHVVRHLHVPTSVVRTIVGSTEGSVLGVGTAAQMSSVFGVAVTSDNSTLYITDNGSNAVRMCDIATGTLRAFVGSTDRSSGSQDGPPAVAKLREPYGLALTADDSLLYICEYGGSRIRCVDTRTRVTTTIAGGDGDTGAADNAIPGQGSEARFQNPQGIAITLDGDTLYCADRGGNRIRVVT